jgi:hypothetical protein
MQSLGSEFEESALSTTASLKDVARMRGLGNEFQQSA